MVTLPTIKCKSGCYPVAVIATKGGKPIPGATVRFESWTPFLGLRVGYKSVEKKTGSSGSLNGISSHCFLLRSSGIVSIKHQNEDFGSGKGQWKLGLGHINSISSPKTFTAVAKVTPLPTPKVPVVEPTPIPIPALPVLPVFAEPTVKLPTGRVGAVTRLHVMNFFENLPTSVGGAFWGCEGASRNSADIVQVTPSKNVSGSIIERQRNIKVGQTRQFRIGFSVKVIRVLLSGRKTYADVIIAPYRIVPTKPAPVIQPIILPITKPVAPPVTKPPVTVAPPVTPEKTHKRITRILSGGQDLPKANKGESVNITAESYCVVNGKIDKSNVPSVLLVDGVISARKPVVNGIVSYEWIATSVPSRHTICVHINPTDTCKSIGRDCKKISVSSSTLDLSDQLSKERASAKEQRELIKRSRMELREEIIKATREAPTYEYPTVPITPLVTTTPPIVTQPLIPKPVVIPTGNIKLTGLPISVPDDVPAYIYIDNINKGKIPVIPMTLTSIPVGMHSVYIMADEFKSISKSIEVTADETTIVSLL